MRESHPILHAVAGLLSGDEHAPQLLPKDAVVLRGMLEKTDDAELHAAVEELAGFAHFLETERHAPLASRLVLEVALTALPRLQEIAGTASRNEGVREASRRAATKLLYPTHAAGSGLPDDQ